MDVVVAAVCHFSQFKIYIFFRFLGLLPLEKIVGFLLFFIFNICEFSCQSAACFIRAELDNNAHCFDGVSNLMLNYGNH